MGKVHAGSLVKRKSGEMRRGLKFFGPSACASRKHGAAGLFVSGQACNLLTVLEMEGVANSAKGIPLV